MTIQQELSAELKDALREKDQRRKDAIRSVETEVAKAKAEPGFSGEIDDALYQRVIGSYVKKMEKARKEYEDLGERGAEMAAKLGFETEYLSRWLPRLLGVAATQDLVDEAIAETEAVAAGDAGRVIGYIMKSHKDEVDGALVNQLVRQALGG
jgi:uncharacterized protein YqeY